MSQRSAERGQSISSFLARHRQRRLLLCLAVFAPSEEYHSALRVAEVVRKGRGGRKTPRLSFSNRARGTDHGCCCYVQMHSHSTEMGFILCTWFGEFCSCCCLTALPGPAWVLLNWICQEIISSLYTQILITIEFEVQLQIKLTIRRVISRSS